jgi:hypothetical protein
MTRRWSWSDPAWAAIDAQRVHARSRAKTFSATGHRASCAEFQPQWRIWQRCSTRLGSVTVNRIQFNTRFRRSYSWPAPVLPTLRGSSRSHTPTPHTCFRITGHDWATALIAEAKKFAPSNAYLAERLLGRGMQLRPGAKSPMRPFRILQFATRNRHTVTAASRARKPKIGHDPFRPPNLPSSDRSIHSQLSGR